MLRDNKGFSLAFSIFLIILVSMVILLLFTIFTQFMSFARMEGVATQDYHHAEFGIYRAEWRLKNGYVTPLPTAGNDNVETYAIDATTSVVIRISLNITPDFEYDLTASSGGSNITAHYASGAVVVWD